MKKKVIYTCLVGDYDNLSQPEVIYDDFDYICYTNHILESHIGIWEVRPIPFQCEDKTRLSRYVKINPHLVLANYEFSIYIDANIVIADNYLKDKTSSLINNNVIWAQIEHSFVNCVYDEIIRCAELAKDKVSVLLSQYRFLKNQGYPSNLGLYENGVIFRKHNDSKVIQISEGWWETYTNFSRRDQHCLCYVYWKLNFIPELLLPKGYDTRNHHGFKYKQHVRSVKVRLISALKIKRNRYLLFFYKKIRYKKMFIKK